MIIHQIFFSFSEESKLSELQLKLIEMNKRINSDCTHILWDIQTAYDFVDKHYPELSKTFRLETEFPILKCDFFRYVLMYHFDNCAYFDLDFAAVRPLSSLQKKYPNAEIFISKEWYNSDKTNNSFHNGCMISRKKNHPFWEFMIRKCVQNIPKVCEQNEVWKMTGTKLLYESYILTFNLLHRNNIQILDYPIFCSYLLRKGGEGEFFVMNGSKEPPPSMDTSYNVPIEHLDHFVNMVPDALFVLIYMKSMWR